MRPATRRIGTLDAKVAEKGRPDVALKQIRKVGIVGAGQMGSGIAHVAALAGYDVLVNDLSPIGSRRPCRPSAAI
jgi:phosphoglycerate dehydrogenase-like enzyme